MIRTMGKRMVVSVIVLAAGLLLLCGLLGLLIIREVITPELGRTAATILALVLVFGVCWYLARSAPKQRLAVSVLAAGSAVLTGLVCKSLAFSQCLTNWRAVLIVLAASVGAGLLASGKKQRRR